MMVSILDIWEMYDCGLVRVDELAEISYGEQRFPSVDLSFLEEDTREDMNTPLVDDDTDVIQVQGMAGNFFTNHSAGVLNAAKQLDANDTGIKDIQGNLTEGVENVIAAVDAEKRAAELENEPILVKKEVSVEKARADRAKTTNQEVRNKIYQKWVGYVEELFAIVDVHASEDVVGKIRKMLVDYGYNDVEVLLQSPEE